MFFPHSSRKKAKNSSVVSPRADAILVSVGTDPTKVGYRLLNMRHTQVKSTPVSRAIPSRLNRLRRPMSARVSLVSVDAVVMCTE